MSSNVAVIETQAVAITSEQKELIRKTICKDATDAEMQLFFFDCQRRGVHPLDKLIHFTKRKGKYVPITSIDFFRIRAHGSGVFDGEDPAVFEIGEDGFPDKCEYTVYRNVNGQRRAWHATARWSEYYPGEELGFNWKKMPFLMLAKCAEALALRKAFPAELQGLYVKEEMDQAGPEISVRKGQPTPYQLPQEPPSSVLEPSTEEALKEMGVGNGSETGTPADHYLGKLRTAHTVKEVNEVYAAIPEELKQDCHSLYFDRLKELGKAKK